VLERLTRAGLLSLLLGACRDRVGPPAPSAEPSASPVPSLAASARRPTRHYYLGRTQARCELFWVDGDQVSSPTAAPCPADLQTGERIRRAGKTCLREGSDPERRLPVVCPERLVFEEALDRASAPSAP
jgi:hypothetical protein